MIQQVEDVRRYWDSHLNLTQFVGADDLGSDAFYERLERQISRYDYKEPLLQRFAESMSAEDGDKKLLEIGCGLGVELSRLAELGFQVTGIDLSERAVEVCNGLLQRKGLDGIAEAQNAEQLSFSDATFDAVYSSGVLQHTPNIEAAISEIERVLKPGGRLLIILYHRRSWFYLLHRLTGTNVEFESDDAPIINAYTRSELQHLFRAFCEAEIDTQYYYPLPTVRTGTLPRMYNRVIVPIVGALPASLIRRFGWHLVLTLRKQRA